MDKARKLGLDEFVQANPSKFQHAELFRSLQKLTLDYRLNDIYTCLVRPSDCLAFYDTVDWFEQRLLFLADKGWIKSTCTRKHIKNKYIQTCQTLQMLLIYSVWNKWVFGTVGPSAYCWVFCFLIAIGQSTHHHAGQWRMCDCETNYLDSLLHRLSRLVLYWSFQLCSCKSVLLTYTRCYFNVRSKAHTSQLNLPHETKN